MIMSSHSAAMASEKPRKPRQTWTLPQEDVETLRKLAGCHCRTPSGELAFAVKAWIKQHADELADELKDQ